MQDIDKLINDALNHSDIDVDEYDEAEMYIRACQTMPGFVKHAVGYKEDDYVNRVFTVRIYYTDYFTDKKFKL